MGQVLRGAPPHEPFASLDPGGPRDPNAGALMPIPQFYTVTALAPAPTGDVGGPDGGDGEGGDGP